jgi:transmembrane sensor
MDNNQQFEALLDRYIEGIISPGEFQQLLKLVKSGAYDDLLKKSIDNKLVTGEITADIDENRSTYILQSILNSDKTEAKIRPITKSVKKYTYLIAAAASIILILITGWWLLPSFNKTKGLAIKNSKKILQPIANNKEKKYIHLQDGSTVLLNNGSRLEYPDEFTGKTREVTLVGEGYFDIQHDASRPFIVHTGKLNTVVLGTAFNIRAYPSQKEIVVTVTRGKVKVGDSGKTYGIITPNESIVVNTASNTHKQEKANAEHIVEWKKAYLVLDDVSLEEAATLINSRYHVNITFSKESLKQCRISASFVDNENLEQVLTVLTGVVNAVYKMQPNDQVIISGEGCQ